MIIKACLWFNKSAGFLVALGYTHAYGSGATWRLFGLYKDKDDTNILEGFLFSNEENRPMYPQRKVRLCVRDYVVDYT